MNSDFKYSDFDVASVHLDKIMKYMEYCKANPRKRMYKPMIAKKKQFIADLLEIAEWAEAELQEFDDSYVSVLHPPTDCCAQVCDQSLTPKEIMQLYYTSFLTLNRVVYNSMPSVVNDCRSILCTWYLNRFNLNKYPYFRFKPEDIPINIDRILIALGYTYRTNKDLYNLIVDDLSNWPSQQYLAKASSSNLDIWVTPRTVYETTGGPNFYTLATSGLYTPEAIILEHELKPIIFNGFLSEQLHSIENHMRQSLSDYATWSYEDLLQQSDIKGGI